MQTPEKDRRRPRKDEAKVAKAARKPAKTKSELICHGCKEAGHKLADCTKRQSKRQHRQYQDPANPKQAFAVEMVDDIPFGNVPEEVFDLEDDPLVLATFGGSRTTLVHAARCVKYWKNPWPTEKFRLSQLVDRANSEPAQACCGHIIIPVEQRAHAK